MHAPHEELVLAGDLAYAPPELKYGTFNPSAIRRRRAADLYHLGSLGLFLFTGVGATAAMASRLPESLLWGTYVGDYQSVVPYLRDALGFAIRDLAAVTTQDLGAQLTPLLHQLCEPDPEIRGDPWARAHAGNQYSLERYVSRLNLLARRAELAITNQ